MAGSSKDFQWSDVLMSVSVCTMCWCLCLCVPCVDVCVCVYHVLVCVFQVVGLHMVGCDEMWQGF